jgi:RNA polymerase sigma-70 factor (ECF subfamily)
VSEAVERAVADAHRREWAFVLAATVRVTRDLDAAEESVQEAYLAALGAWERDGVPDRPSAWLTTVARRNALNALQRRRTLERKLPLLIEPDEPPGPRVPGGVRTSGGGAGGGVGGAGAALGEDGDDDTAIPDDRLRLVFACCHPALAREAQVALTLRLVCGVETADVAHAFLVPVPTMAARLTRAKKKIAAAGIPYAVPAPQELPERLDAALTVVHLLSATGHAAPTGQALVREELSARALQLARTLHELLPGEREAAGLLALLLVHDARRATRTDADGRLVRLADQDRSRWDRDAIAEADRLVVAALKAGPAGRFTLQAAIAALHAQSPSHADTDWPQIVELYDALLRVWPSPVVALNRAVAVAAVDGPAAALAEVEAIERDGRLAGYRYLHSTKAELLRRLGRDGEAADAYRAALELTGNSAEQAFLEARISASSATAAPPRPRRGPPRP